MTEHTIQIAASSVGASNIVAIIILVAFLLGTVVWLFSRYKMCPSDKILIV